MRFLLIVILSLNSVLARSQTKIPSKDEVTILVKPEGRLTLTDANTSCEKCSEWWTINTDSLFFKLDTLYFYNDVNFTIGDALFCQAMRWEFYKKGAFKFYGVSQCEEPPKTTIETLRVKDGQIVKIDVPDRFRITSDANGTYIELLSGSKVNEIFSVLETTKVDLPSLKEQCIRLTLLRCKLD